jgi:hypothetical protein
MDGSIIVQNRGWSQTPYFFLAEILYQCSSAGLELANLPTVDLLGLMLKRLDMPSHLGLSVRILVRLICYKCRAD